MPLLYQQYPKNKTVAAKMPPAQSTLSLCYQLLQGRYIGKRKTFPTYAGLSVYKTHQFFCQ